MLIDLEKAFAIWWLLKRLGVSEVMFVHAMYEGTINKIRIHNKFSKEFNVPMEVTITKEFKTGYSWRSPVC